MVSAGAIMAGLLASAAILLAALIGMLSLEIAAGVFVRSKRLSAISASTPKPDVAIIVPAHNEGMHLVPTLTDIQSQMSPGDRLLVVADNCSDDTAELARRAGAEVVARDDPTRRGKGYALDWGVRHLSDDPPNVVVFVDADCRLKAGALDALIVETWRTQRPAQAAYLMVAPGSNPQTQFSMFAWHIKNYVRPLGLRALGLPCQLTGSGMAFPWKLISRVTLASGHIVEDMQLGLDAAALGHPPIFCPSACVTSIFPTSTESAERQRQRWELGHITLLMDRAPRLLGRAVTTADYRLLALTMDLAIPPLTLLVLLTATLFALTSLLLLFGGSYTPLLLSLVNLIALSCAIGVAWLCFGRTILPARSLASAVLIGLKKALFYRRLLVKGRELGWIRTDRD